MTLCSVCPSVTYLAGMLLPRSIQAAANGQVAFFFKADCPEREGESLFLVHSSPPDTEVTLKPGHCDDATMDVDVQTRL